MDEVNAKESTFYQDAKLNVELTKKAIDVISAELQQLEGGLGRPYLDNKPTLTSGKTSDSTPTLVQLMNQMRDNRLVLEELGTRLNTVRTQLLT